MIENFFVVLRPECFYRAEVPTAKDVRLIIEVSHSTIAYDHDVKFRSTLSTAFPRSGSLRRPTARYRSIANQRAIVTGAYSHPTEVKAYRPCCCPRCSCR